MRPSGVTRISVGSRTTGLRRAILPGARSSGAKYSSKRYGKFLFDFVLGNHGVAEQPADHGAAQQIVLRKAIAAHGGDAARADGVLIRRNLAAILRVGTADGADGADAHAVEVRAGFGGVALKISVQRAISLGDGEFVAGTREMVHADVEVAGAEKVFEAGAEDAEFFHALGQVLCKRRLAVFSARERGRS